MVSGHVFRVIIELDQGYSKKIKEEVPTIIIMSYHLRTQLDMVSCIFSTCTKVD